MDMSKLVMNVYAWASLAAVLAGLAWMLAAPPHSTRLDRDGVPHFTPMVEHPVTGEGVSVNTLIKHYRGD